MQKVKKYFILCQHNWHVFINSLPFSIPCGDYIFSVSALKVGIHVKVKAKYFKQNSAA